MKPMKAHRWTEKFTSYPCYVQPKLDGIRALWLGNRLQSSDEILWNPSRLPHIFSALKEFPHLYLDGELYCPGLSLGEINSRVAVNSTTPHKDVHQIRFHIFDTIETDQQQIRIDKLLGLLNQLQKSNALEIVPTYYCHDKYFAEQCHKQFKAVGYEGSMLRLLDKPYGFSQLCGNKENRWNHILKRKDTETDICTIIGGSEGEGKYAGKLGSFQLRHPNGVIFEAGGGLSDLQRELFWKNLPVGSKVRIEYLRLTDELRPREPRIVEIIC